MNKRKTGSVAEIRAETYLSEKGVRIVERNFRNRYGEIDLIGYHEGYLVFFEVKYRSNNKKGTPESAVGFYKQLQICKVATFYRCIHKVSWDMPVRYDVVAMEGDTIRWYKNAFEHIG